MAMVGPSGTGKSTLLNSLAGAVVSETGVLRPTTTEPVDWVDPDAGVLLVDTPPSEHDPFALAVALKNADVAVVVTSQSRYADAETWRVVDEAERSGVPLVLVVNRVEDIGEDVVQQELAGSGRKVITVAEGDLARGIGEVRGLVVLVGAHAEEIRAYRKGLAARRVAREVEALAADLAAEAAERAEMRDVVDTAFRSVRTGFGLGEAAELDFAAASFAARQIIGEHADEAGKAATAAWLASGRPLPPPVPDAAEDAAAIERWRAETAAAAAAAIRPGVLRRLARRKVEDESWRLAVDPARRPGGLVRLVLGARLAEIRRDAGTELDDVIAARIDARAEPLRAALRSPEGPDPARLRELARLLHDEHPERPVPAFLEDA